MTTKLTWTDEEKFWRSVRQAALGLVDAVETYKLHNRINIRTAKAREWLKSYRRLYIFPPASAEAMQEQIEKLQKEIGIDNGAGTW